MSKGSYAGGSTVIGKNLQWSTADSAEEKLEKIDKLVPSAKDLAIGENIKRLTAGALPKPEYGNSAKVFKRDKIVKPTVAKARASKRREKPEILARSVQAPELKDFDENRALINKVFGSPIQVTKSRKAYPGIKRS